MTRPNPVVESCSFNSSTREVMIVNPALLSPPSALTPGLTPFPDSKSPPLSSNAKRPWGLSPPPAGPKTKLGEAGGASSSRGWFKRRASGRGPCAMALAFLLGGVLIAVSLGAYVLLVYLAITTQKPKYIAFSSCLGGMCLLIACNTLLSGESGREVRPGGPGRDRRTESEDLHDEEVVRAYGLNHR